MTFSERFGHWRKVHYRQVLTISKFWWKNYGWTNGVNSGNFMDNYWTKTLFMAAMKTVYIDIINRYRQRFFGQFGHEIMYASSGDKPFFTK